MAPEQIQSWVTLIAAIAAAIVSVIAALKGNQAKAEIRALRDQMAKPPPPGFAPPGVNMGDLFRYSVLISELLALVKQLGRLNIGQSLPVPGLKLDLPSGERIVIDPTLAHRER